MRTLLPNRPLRADTTGARYLRPLPSQPGAGRFFCVHSIGGDSADLRDLAAAFPGQFFALDNAGTLFDSIEEMAAAYINTIRPLDVGGGWSVGGYSFGGLVAFEMACQLARRGEPVRDVVVIDHVPPPVRYRPQRWEFPTVMRALTNLGRWFTTNLLAPSADQTAWQAARRAGRQLLRLAAARLTPPGPLDTDYAFSPGSLSHLMGAITHHTRLMRRYRPGFYPGKVTLIRASTMPLFRSYPPDFGWRTLAREVDLRVMFGNHTSIVRGKLAPRLARTIGRLASAPSPTRDPVPR